MNRFTSIRRCLHYGDVLGKGRTSILGQAKPTYKEDGKGNSKERFSKSLKGPQIVSPQSRATSKKARTRLLEIPTSSYEPQRAKKSNLPRKEVDIVKKSKSRGHVFSSLRKSHTRWLENPTSYEPHRARKRNLPRKRADVVKKSRARDHVFSSSHSKSSSNAIINEETPVDRVKSNRRVKRGLTLVINRIAAEKMLLYKDGEFSA